MESVALYSFQATEKDELPFQKGDTLKVQGTREGWMLLFCGDRVMVTLMLSLSLTLMLLGFSVGYKEPTSRILECRVAFPVHLCHQVQLQRTPPGGTWHVASLAVSAASCALCPLGAGTGFPCLRGTGGHRDPAACAQTPTQALEWALRCHLGIPKSSRRAQNVPGGQDPLPADLLIPLAPCSPPGRVGAQPSWNPEPQTRVFSPCPDPGFQILFSQLGRPWAPVWEAGKCCHTEAMSAPTATILGDTGAWLMS